MNSKVATIVCILGIAGLFHLSRERKERTSRALWLPIVWLGINSSRAVSQWLAAFGFGTPTRRTLDQALEGSPLDAAVFAALMFFGVSALVKKKQRVMRLLRANVPVLVFFSYCAVSAFWSDFPGVTLTRWVKAMGDIIMVVIILTESNAAIALKRLFLRLGFVLIPVSILFIKYYGELGRAYSPMGMTEYVGVADNKNSLGMMTLVIGLGCVWYFFLRIRQVRWRWRRREFIAHGVLLLMTGWLLWTANSATSTSCFLIAIGLLALTSLRFATKPAVVHCLIFASISLALFSLFLAPSLLTTVGRDSSLTGRTEIWEQVLGVSGNPWIGSGFESFWMGKRLAALWNLYYFHLNEAHNGYLELFLTLGWIGEFLFSIVVIAGYLNLVRAFRVDPDLVSLKLALFVVALVYNCTESATRMCNPIWIMFFMVTMAVPEEPVPQTSRLPATRNTRGSVMGRRHVLGEFSFFTCGKGAIEAF